MATPSPDAWRAASQTTTWRGHTQRYWDAGEGPVLLVIHGFPTSSWDFAPIWGELTSRFRVIAPDLLGFGFSDKPRDYGYSLVDAASQCEALCDELGVERAHLLAHDYGDSVAQELLARHAEGSLAWTIDSCVLLNGGVFPEQHRPRPIQKLLLTPLGPLLSRMMTFDRFAKSFSAVFSAGHQPTRAELADHWRIIDHQQGARIAHRLIRYIPERHENRDRWVDVLLRPKVPLRLVNGVDDPVSGGHVCDHWLSQDPDADIVRLEGIGHYPQLEAPQRVLAAFDDFHDALD